MMLVSRFASFGLFTLAAVALVAGCDDKSATSSSAGGGASASAAAEPLPPGLMVDKAPENARPVAEVRKSAGDGDEVVVRGRIAGRAEPFTEGRAQFQLVDASVKACSEMPGENCPTPWDMCCEDAKSIADNSLTVQVVGADGRPLKATLNGVNGLKPLSEVAVKGKVKKSPDGKAMMVNATELYVKQG
jgi:hypothetical protein